MFRYDKEERDGIFVLTLRGHLDANTAGALKEEVIALEKMKVSRVIVDLGPLTLVDSTGVGVMISLFKRTRGNAGHVYFAGLNGQPKEIFRLLRLDRSLDVFPSLDDAFQRIKQA